MSQLIQNYFIQNCRKCGKGTQFEPLTIVRT